MTESRKSPQSHQQKYAQAPRGKHAPWPSEREGSGTEWAEAARQETARKREAKPSRGR